MSRWISPFLAATFTVLALGASAQPATSIPRQPVGPQNSAPMGMASMPQMREQMRQHMDTMQALRAKMAAATTPDERQALMAEHTKAVRDGMDMMKGMRPMGGMSGMGAPRAGSVDQSQRQEMMEMRMDMMQSMMEMMMQRIPAPSGDAVTK